VVEVPADVFPIPVDVRAGSDRVRPVGGGSVPHAQGACADACAARHRSGVDPERPVQRTT
ncbi:hypothetical protein JTE90_004126, partial [Oedothorax gibbosus]